MDFETRHKKLNAAQAEAVDSVDGPLMVIAGPGTGKTELLSMRVAQILRTTDTLPQNILCLTFTESGALAMRKRLVEIIGTDAYLVTIHTFHSFGAQIMGQNREYFYRGADFSPADEITSLETLTKIFDELDHTNPLSVRMNDEYTYLRDARRTISELKRSGLTSDELLKILDAGDHVLDEAESDIQAIFSDRISMKMLPKLATLSQKVAGLEPPSLPRGITPLSHTLALSLAHAVDQAEEQDSTKPITAWKNAWCEKDSRDNSVFKSRRRHEKLRAMSFIYFRYLTELERAGLYDFDDMILEVIHAIEINPELKYNLQETYQYILVDEFQDTNLAQMRLLLNLVDNPVNEGAPNLMVVGDDDQAIYSFQGAEVGNIMQLLRQYPSMKKVTLTDNYRSAPAILDTARAVITQGQDRLENFDTELNKTLTPHVSVAESHVTVYESFSNSEQSANVAKQIKGLIKKGAQPDEIAVLARKHSELEAFLPYLTHEGVAANYDKQDNLLDLEIIRTVELTAEILHELHLGHIDHIDALLPEFLTLPALHTDPQVIWKLGLKAYQEKRRWIELMSVTPELSSIHTWLTTLSTEVENTPCLIMIDKLFGLNDGLESPLHDYFFATAKREEDPDNYLLNLDALASLRDHLTHYLNASKKEDQSIGDMLDFLDLHRRFNQKITLTRRSANELEGAIQLMTAHRSKGLEFTHVFVLNLDDRTWGSRARGVSNKLTYPENLPLAPHTGSRDEQLRLLYVAMTRAKKDLALSFATTNASEREQTISDLLPVDALQSPKEIVAKTTAELIESAELDWRAPLLSLPKNSLQTLLAPSLEKYKLSATHINNFVDVSRGGPEYFLLQNFLHMPSTPSPNACFGIAIHTSLQLAETHLLATGSERPLEDVLGDFETTLATMPLAPDVQNFYTQKGIDTLQKFLSSPFTGFSTSAKPEFDFSHQNVTFDDVRITGKLDLAIIDSEEKTLRVIDYKTGRSSTRWQGKTDYEKIKLRKYTQQLMFYRLLAEYSSEYSHFDWAGGAIQFVEPDQQGEILPPLEADFSSDDYEKFKKLVRAVWHCIQRLELPDISKFPATYAGMCDFEDHLIDKYS